MTESDATRAARMNRNSEAIEGLVAANSASNDTMIALVRQVQAETEARDRKIEVMERSQRQMKKLVVLVSIATAILLCVAVVNAVNISSARTQQQQVRDLSERQPQIVEQVKEYNLVGYYCLRINPVTVDPKGEAFLKCMERLYPGGPQLMKR